MLDKAFFDKLKSKYNYDEKTLRALSKIVPCIIKYYGEEYEYIILDAILNTEIIACDSKQTISKVARERKQSKMIGDSLLGNIDLNFKKPWPESVYIPNIKVIYDDTYNTYEIDKIDRIIVTSHTFNYDSPKGIEVLTHALCHLVKSYKDEVIVNENFITIRSGISYEKRKIRYDDDIFLEFVSDYGKGLEEGFTILDTEKIVSMVLQDKYICYDFKAIYTVAEILKDKYGLLKDFNGYEICGDIDKVREVYDKDAIDRLCKICDECVSMENEMLLSYTKEDKNRLADILGKKLSEEAFKELVAVYKSKKTNVKN